VSTTDASTSCEATAGVVEHPSAGAPTGALTMSEAASSSNIVDPRRALMLVCKTKIGSLGAFVFFLLQYCLSLRPKISVATVSMSINISQIWLDLSPPQNKCCYGIHVGQHFSNLARFVENICNICIFIKDVYNENRSNNLSNSNNYVL
jgi:hypothetical protein